MFRLAQLCLLLLLAACSRPYSVDLGAEKDSAADLLRAVGLDPAQTGLLLYDPAKREVVLAHNRTNALIPASVSKLATAVAALDALGPEHRFVTRVVAGGDLRDGTWRGNLWLVGGGDPTLTMVDLERMARELAATGLRTVAGAFFYDESAAPTNGLVNPLMEHVLPFNPGLGGLAVEWNTLSAEWDTERGRLRHWLVPEVPLARAADPGQRSASPWMYAFAWKDGRETWKLPSTVGERGRELLPVKRPGLFAAQFFRKVAALHGVVLPEPRAGRAPSGGAELVRHAGEPLLVQVEAMLLWSNNMIAELLCHAAAKRLAGKAELTREAAAAAVARHLAERIRGVDWSTMVFANGSGLTSATRLTPEQLVALLAYAGRTAWGGRAFATLLPCAGFRGSLVRRLARPETQLRVWAKTGGINYVTALAGVLVAGSGRRFLFAVLHNDLAKRTAADRAAARDPAANQEGAFEWSEDRVKRVDRLVTRLVEGF